ncbi:hypothetical protein HPP92_016887 [Vanilla planifolia]|uniref:non-specific serine/threonine protein kinase n=1 Tax=Vanilla planifolia TaxID=51239 RepID=A0A835QFM2_VANPL|nr:hypothetical protein HPP92_016887 [Vanilla planifolia]
MKMVTHPNIVELDEVMATKSKIYFAMELVRGGELFSKIARVGRLREGTARHYFRQLISAVDFCHSRGVYHRDLKPENLLLDDAGNLKVADFGLSAFADHLRPDGLLHTTCGTPAYVAPEVICKKGYDGAKADLWSCGVILFVLLAGFLPFQDDNLIAMYRKIHRGDFRCPPWFSSDARRLVIKLLDPNPNTRITVAKLLDTPGSENPQFRNRSLPETAILWSHRPKRTRTNPRGLTLSTSSLSPRGLICRRFSRVERARGRRGCGSLPRSRPAG